jgi:hypothetical protein
MKYPRFLTLVAGVMAISACSDSDNDDQPAVPPSAQAEVRITHASPDAPKVNVYVDGALALEGVDYKQSSGILTRAAGAVEVEVRGILADGSETTVIGPAQLDLAENTRTDVVAINTLAAIEPKLITDDDADAREYVELKPGAQWVQIDLEESAAMYAILIWHYHLEPRAYHDIIVQVSDDEDFIKGVKLVFNSDHDNTSGLGKGKDPAYVETNEGRLIDAKGIKGRYVRIYSRGSTGSDANHYTEIAIYGKR